MGRAIEGGGMMGITTGYWLWRHAYEIILFVSVA